MSSDTNNLYAFKDFTLDGREDRLLRQGTPVPITRKAFQMLRILVEHHGSVVEKEELIAEIWADSVVEEGNLAFTARLLRKVLGDDAKRPTFIETVPRKGYKFIAEVSKVPDPEEAQNWSRVKRANSFNQQGTLLRIGVGAIVAVLLTIGWFFLSRNEIQTRSAPILIEPFKAERLSSTGNAVQTDMSPNGKLIAYTDQTGNGKWSVWLRQVSSGENIQLLEPAELQYGGFAFSNDSNSLLLTRGDGRLDVYRVSIFGGVPTKLIEGTQGWISVSPDDKWISFVRCDYSANDYCSLFMADIDGRNERRLATRSAPIRIGDNKFSTDGRSIAFAAGQSRTGSDDFELFNVDVATGNESPITPERFFNIKSIEWLPGGNELLFTARRHTQQTFSIWKASIATGSVTQLTRDDANFSKLSLDAEARNLVVTKFDNKFTIFVEDVQDRSKRRALTPGMNCVFAPDGRIVFQSNDGDVWITNSDGKNKRQLTSDASSDVNPLVTGDGRGIVFSSNRSGINHIWRMNIDGSDQRQLTQAEGGHSNFVSSDGKIIYYTADISRALRRLDGETGVEADLPPMVGVLHSFSPDGKVVASFIRDESSGGLKIRVQDLADRTSAKSTDVGDAPSDAVNLEWTRDGESINYVVRRSGEYQFLNYSLRTDKHVLLANLGNDPLGKVMLAPDGQSIATVRGGWLHDAFLVTGLKL